MVCTCGYILYKRNDFWICSNYLNNGKKCCNFKVLESEFLNIFRFFYDCLNINYNLFKGIDLTIINNDLLRFFIKKVLVKIKIVSLDNYIIYVKNISFNDFNINYENSVVKFINVC